MMRLPPFRFFTPASVKEAVNILAGEGPEAVPVAGGTDLYPNMKRLHQTPKVLVALSRLGALKGITGTPEEGLVIRSGETLTDVCAHPVVKAAYPALAHAVRSISTPILRNMGTIGGNVCLDTRCNYYNQNYAWRKAIDFCMKKEGEICWVAPGSPRCWAVQSSDSAPLLVAMRARFKVAGPRGARLVEAADFFADDGIRYLTKKPNELLTEIRLPATNGWKAAYQKLRRRGAFDFPVLGVAAFVRFAPDGRTVREARIVLGGVGSAPKLAEEASAFLTGKALEADTIRAASERVSPAAKPLDNTDLAMHWRRKMARVWTARALEALRS